MVAEVKGRVVGNSEVGRKTSGHDKHVGTLGIVIRNCYRGLGLGTEMMKTLIEQARAMNLKLLTLGVYATNQHAHHVYQSVGFMDVGQIPRKFFKDGQSVDEIVMAKSLE